MRTLGVVGSPHKNGLTYQLVTRALEGAKSAGTQTELLYLVDYDFKHCMDCDSWSLEDGECWLDGKCRKSPVPEVLNNKLDSSDALVLGAPVYYLDVNGLTKCFMDVTRTLNVNGKPALGIVVAGGTGKGLTSAIKSIYQFFFVIGLRGIDPLPVSRFNFKSALDEAYTLGRRLAERSEKRKPFKKLAESIAHHYNLRYMNYDVVDENLLLAKQLIENTKPEEETKLLLKRAKKEYEEAKRLINQGKKAKAIEHIMNSYNHGVKAWDLQKR